MVVVLTKLMQSYKQDCWSVRNKNFRFLPENVKGAFWKTGLWTMSWIKKTTKKYTLVINLQDVLSVFDITQTPCPLQLSNLAQSGSWLQFAPV